MKVLVIETQTKEINVKTLKVEIAVRYGEEDIPNNFPLRKGDMWNATIDIDEGRVIDWPKGQKGYLNMKVSDEGTYMLYDANGTIVKALEQDYVPNKLLPGKYGDYIELCINENGLITNWYSQPSLSDFFEEEEQTN
jgi:hypothetical protein